MLHKLVEFFKLFWQELSKTEKNLNGLIFFLYQHIKCTIKSPNYILVQTVEELIFQKNSFLRLKIIKRHETELKGIKSLQTPFPFGLMIIFTKDYSAVGHVLNGNWKIISDSKILQIVSKGPKYGFPSNIDFK